MDATDDEREVDDDGRDGLTDDVEDDKWTDDDDDSDDPDDADDQGERISEGDQYALPERNDEDDDGMDKDEYEYGESEKEIESDLLERLSAFSGDESVSSKSSLQSVSIEGIVKIPFTNGKVHLMDKENKGRFISTSGFAYGVKQSSNLVWSSGAHMKGITAETVVHILVFSLWMMRIPIMLIDVMR